MSSAFLLVSDFVSASGSRLFEPAPNTYRGSCSEPASGSGPRNSSVPSLVHSKQSGSGPVGSGLERGAELGEGKPLCLRGRGGGAPIKAGGLPGSVHEDECPLLWLGPCSSGGGLPRLRSTGGDGDAADPAWRASRADRRRPEGDSRRAAGGRSCRRRRGRSWPWPWMAFM